MPRRKATKAQAFKKKYQTLIDNCAPEEVGQIALALYVYFMLKEPDEQLAELYTSEQLTALNSQVDTPELYARYITYRQFEAWINSQYRENVIECANLVEHIEHVRERVLNILNAETMEADSEELTNNPAMRYFDAAMFANFTYKADSSRIERRNIQFAMNQINAYNTLIHLCARAVKMPELVSALAVDTTEAKETLERINDIIDVIHNSVFSANNDTGEIGRVKRSAFEEFLVHYQTEPDPIPEDRIDAVKKMLKGLNAFSTPMGGMDILRAFAGMR